MKKRNKPKWTMKQKYKVLYQSCYKCHYCNTELTFETMIMEHFKPYRITRSNSVKEVVASCNDCNSIKSDKVFDSFDDARKYINNERKKRNLPYLQSIIHSQPLMAEILLPKVPNNQLLEEQPSKANLIDPSRLAQAYFDKRYSK